MYKYIALAALVAAAAPAHAGELAPYGGESIKLGRTSALSPLL